ncbi:MAG TPA: hypothetical protein C5S51_01650 [Methanosarcinaceae archaeon]|nr:hypothetical protein [Methanosarcinaceae archaeon]
MQKGQSIDLNDDLVLIGKSIYVQNSCVNLSLTRSGENIDNKVVSQKSLCTFILNEIGNEKDVPMVVTYVDKIFAGTATTGVKLANTWAVSFDVETIE